MQRKPVKLDSSVLRGRTRGYTSRPLVAVPPRHVATTHHKSSTVSELLPPLKNIEPVRSAPVHKVSHQPAQVAQQTSYRLQVSSRKSQRKPQLSNRRVLKHVPTLPIPAPKGIYVVWQKIRTAVKNIPRPNKRFIIAVSCSAGLIIVCSYFIAHKAADDSFTAYRKAGVAASNLAVAKAAEVQPTIGAIQNYKVSPDEPRVLTMPQLGIMAPIKPLTPGSAAIISPQNIYDIGWYSSSAKPGNPGVVVVTGNVAGSTKDGVFHNLSKLTPGSIVAIERGDGEIIRYKVMGSDTTNGTNDELAKIIKPYDKTKQGLNLVTANSTISNQSNTSNQQLVVYAVRDN